MNLAYFQISLWWIDVDLVPIKLTSWLRMRLLSRSYFRRARYLQRLFHWKQHCASHEMPAYLASKLANASLPVSLEPTRHCLLSNCATHKHTRTHICATFQLAGSWLDRIGRSFFVRLSNRFRTAFINRPVRCGLSTSISVKCPRFPLIMNQLGLFCWLFAGYLSFCCYCVSFNF